VARPAATSRDPDEWSRATAAAREVRRHAAREVAGVIAAQVEELVVAGDIMGGRALFARRVREIAEAERRGDVEALRAAVMDGAVALGAWVAALDYRPSVLGTSGTAEGG
jgi:hypothetical protein